LPRESRLLATYAAGFCNDARPMLLSYIDASGVTQSVPGTFRWR
jgi:hypothetical protein